MIERAGAGWEEEERLVRGEEEEEESLFRGGRRSRGRGGEGEALAGRPDGGESC